jgi:hypothetical protein
MGAHRWSKAIARPAKVSIVVAQNPSIQRSSLSSRAQRGILPAELRCQPRGSLAPLGMTGLLLDDDLGDLPAELTRDRPGARRGPPRPAVDPNGQTVQPG